MGTLQIISSTEDYLVVQKPPMLVCQSDSANSPTLFDQAVKVFPDDQLHLLTRIDQPVSGLVLLSKNKNFLKHFTQQQTAKKVVKSYLALVEGQWKYEQNCFNHFITKNQKARKANINDKGKGKSVESNIELLSTLDRYSLLRVQITSGKFHQIRAQLSYLGHPIKGDVKYRARRKNKDRYIMLHSHKISFACRNEQIELESPIPENDPLWNTALDAIEANH